MSKTQVAQTDAEKIAELEAKLATLNTPAQVVEPIDPLIALNALLEEKIEIKLFKDTKDYKDALFVNVNGDAVLIPRGIKTMVKKKHVLVIDAQEAQDDATAKLLEELQAEYTQSLKQI